ncbi:MAG: hypothetical protein AB7I50_23490 [Vicinamibacterales bacterium]
MPRDYFALSEIHRRRDETSRAVDAGRRARRELMAFESIVPGTE